MRVLVLSDVEDSVVPDVDDDDPEFGFDVATGSETELVPEAAAVEERASVLEVVLLAEAAVPVRIGELDVEADEDADADAEEEPESLAAATKGLLLFPPVPLVRSRLNVPSELC